MSGTEKPVQPFAAATDYATDAAGILRAPDGRVLVTLGDIESELNGLHARAVRGDKMCGINALLKQDAVTKLIAKVKKLERESAEIRDELTAAWMAGFERGKSHNDKLTDEPASVTKQPKGN